MNATESRTITGEALRSAVWGVYGRCATATAINETFYPDAGGWHETPHRPIGGNRWDMLADYMNAGVERGAEEWNVEIGVAGDSTYHHADFALAELVA